mgnify:CR=1 FL=1
MVCPVAAFPVTAWAHASLCVVADMLEEDSRLTTVLHLCGLCQSKGILHKEAVACLLLRDLKGLRIADSVDGHGATVNGVQLI